MAWYQGTDGVVKVGANVVAEVEEFELETGANIITSARTMGEEWEENRPGKKRWRGRISCLRDETDANGQGGLLEGAEVTLTLVPRGETAGNQTFSGTAVVEDLTQRQAGDGRIEIEFRFVGAAALTRGTVPV